jgi:HPt (histidine-containing phosphotransfer) domain-containing protein
MGAVVDLAQLELMTGGDAELAAEALGIFRSQADLWGQLLDSGAAPAQWADACHAIKGAARSVGAMDLGEACGRAEELGRSGDVSPVQASVAVSEVKDRLGEAIEALAHVEHQLMLNRTFTGLRLA